MIRRALGSLSLTFVLTMVSAAGAHAQVAVRWGDATLTVGGRLHTQYVTTSVKDHQPSSNFFVRRARVNFDVGVTDWIDARLQTEYVVGVVDLLDAYMRFKFSPGFQVTFGQFKRPFDLFELDSSTELPFIERDARVPGVESCPGVGKVCSLSRFTEALMYSNRDMGIRVAGSAGDLDYAVAVTNGETLSQTGDNRGAKSWSGRLSYGLTDNLTVAGNFSAHDYYIEDVGDQYGYAWGGDLNYGDYQDGLHVMFGLIGGDNWENLDDDNQASKFLTSQILGSYYIETENSRVVAVEPVFRVSYGDADTNVADSSGWVVEPGLFAYFGGRNRIGINLSTYTPEGGDMEYAIRMQTYLHF